MQLREKTGVMYSSQPDGGHICVLRGSEERNTVEFIFLLKIKIILDVTLRRLVVVTNDSDCLTLKMEAVNTPKGR
jgi:hypothetical protein